MNALPGPVRAGERPGRRPRRYSGLCRRFSGGSPRRATTDGSTTRDCLKGTEFDDAEPTTPRLVPVYLTIPGNIKRPEVPGAPGHLRLGRSRPASVSITTSSDPMDVTRTGAGACRTIRTFTRCRRWRRSSVVEVDGRLPRAFGGGDWIHPLRVNLVAQRVTRPPRLRRDPRSIDNGGDFIAGGESFEAFEGIRIWSDGGRLRPGGQRFRECRSDFRHRRGAIRRRQGVCARRRRWHRQHNTSA